MERCLHDIGPDTLPDARTLPLHIADALGCERELLRQRLGEPEMYFVVTPVEAEAHLIIDLTGDVRDADDVERGRIRLWLGSDAERG